MTKGKLYLEKIIPEGLSSLADILVEGLAS
jgi:hypothetical protein